MANTPERVPDSDWSALSVQDRYRASVGGLGTQHGVNVLGPYRARLILSDVIAIATAIAIGLVVSSRQTAWLIDPLVAIYGTPIAIGVLWVTLIALRGGYDQRFIGVGTDGYRRLFSATIYTFAVVSGTSYLIRADISRAYAYVALPLGLVLASTGRFLWRKWLYQQRNAGRFLARTLVVGDRSSTESLAFRLESDAYAGYQVVGMFGLPAEGGAAIAHWLEQIDAALVACDAHAVAIDPGRSAPHEAVRQLAWRLEGRGIDLLISPGMLDVAGPRLSVRPASGLPLLHLDEAALSRPQRIAKRVLDLIVASAAILVLSPVMLTCALAVRISSPGPVLFCQPRVGRAGQTFVMFKFRSMRRDADREREQLRRVTQQDEPMFKLVQDPRVTPVGRFLRRWSFDELPQLFNVVGGSMSLVGPRPHPLDDVSRYEKTAYRRLALKPGMTGLWQVEGRSDLDWSQALKLDLHYVESWSLSTDLILLFRTLRTVIHGRGAI